MDITSAFLKRLDNRAGRPWQGNIKYRDPEDPAKRRQITKVFDRNTVKTKTQALAALSEWREQVEAEAGRKPSQQAVEYVADYIELLEKSGSVESSTLRDYRATAKYMEDGLGGVMLDALSPSQVQEWESSLLGRGLSAQTVLKAHRLLKQVCRHAVAIGDLDRNPCEGVKPPKRQQTDPDALDKAGRNKLLDKLEGMEQTPLATATYIALYTGMRRGEVCALTWNDVDLDRAEIRVKGSIGIGSGGAYPKTPKTGGSRRTVPIPPALVSVLARRRDRMRAEWQAYVMGLEVPKSEAEFSKLYVVGDVAGNWYNPATLCKEWTVVAKAFGITTAKGNRCTFHDLRHTFATLAIAEGADVKSVSSILGHSNAAMTLNIYASADAEAKRRAAEIVAKALERKPADVLHMEAAV